MIATQSEELLNRLRRGILDPADVHFLEHAQARELRTEFTERYPIVFQERQIRDKWELSVAASLRFELASRRTKSGSFPLLLLVPVLGRCVFLSGEGDLVTGIRLAAGLRVKPSRAGLAIRTGRGFKLDHTPDGWAIKPAPARTVQLSEDFLRKRGWRFDAFQPLSPRP